MSKFHAERKLSVSMFTLNWAKDIHGDVSIEQIQKVMKSLDIEFLEMVPSYIWGNDWKWSEAELENFPIKVSSIQSLLYGTEICLSSYNEAPEIHNNWLKRKQKIAEISHLLKPECLILGSPQTRKKSKMGEEFSLLEQKKYISELLKAIPITVGLGYENCSHEQGAEFALGLKGALNVITSIPNVNFGLNFDFESWVVETGESWREELDQLWSQLFGVRVLNIQFGQSILEPSVLQFLISLSERHDSPLGLEDVRLNELEEIQEIVQLIRNHP